jgi:hypothetical protein
MEAKPLENRPQVVAVFGGSRRDEDSRLYREAYELGSALARAGYTVLNGGYGGSMAAISHGAADAGGHVIGVTCSIFDPLLPNRWLTEEIREPDLLARLRTMVERADAFVTLRGGIGTLSELTLAWSLLQTRAFAKPLVLLGTEWQDVLDAFHAYTDIGDSIMALVQVVPDPSGAVAALAAPRRPMPPLPPAAG